MVGTTRTRTRRTNGAVVPRRAGRRRSGGSGGKRDTWMYWVGGIALSLVVTLAFKMSHKSSDDGQVRREMIEVVQTFPDYAENAGYYTDLVDRYHHQAFEAAYSMGGRRRAATIDAKAYLAQISRRMADKASADGRTSVASTLNTFNQAIREAGAEVQ